MIIKTERFTIRTIKTKTLKKKMDKLLAELVMKLNVEPTLIDDFTTDSMLDTYRKVIDIIQKVEKTGRQKLYLVTGNPFLSTPVNITSPINIIYWCKEFAKERFYERSSSYANKRIPKHYILLHSFYRRFSPIKKTECDLFFAIPNEIPKISIDFLPVFKGEKTVFVRKDKLNLVEN